MHQYASRMTHKHMHTRTHEDHHLIYSTGLTGDIIIILINELWMVSMSKSNIRICRKDHKYTLLSLLFAIMHGKNELLKRDATRFINVFAAKDLLKWGRDVACIAVVVWIIMGCDWYIDIVASGLHSQQGSTAQVISTTQIRNTGQRSQGKVTPEKMGRSAIRLFYHFSSSKRCTRCLFGKWSDVRVIVCSRNISKQSINKSEVHMKKSIEFILN